MFSQPNTKKYKFNDSANTFFLVAEGDIRDIDNDTFSDHALSLPTMHNRPFDNYVTPGSLGLMILIIGGAQAQTRGISDNYLKMSIAIECRALAKKIRIKVLRNAIHNATPIHCTTLSDQ